MHIILVSDRLAKARSIQLSLRHLVLARPASLPASSYCCS